MAYIMVNPLIFQIHILGWRVEVVLKDERMEVPYYLGTWHLHLPSDLMPVTNLVVWLQLHMISRCALGCSAYMCVFRIHSMYTYDVDLFRDRWLGPPGVTCIKFSQFDNMCVNVYLCMCTCARMLCLNWGFGKILGCTARNWMVQNASYTLQSSDLHMHLWPNIFLYLWGLGQT